MWVKLSNNMVASWPTVAAPPRRLPPVFAYKNKGGGVKKKDRGRRRGKHRERREDREKEREKERNKEERRRAEERKKQGRREKKSSPLPPFDHQHHQQHHRPPLQLEAPLRQVTSCSLVSFFFSLAVPAYTCMQNVNHSRSAAKCSVGWLLC